MSQKNINQKNVSGAQKKEPIPIEGNPFAKVMKDLQGLEDDFAKFYDKGNKTAGTRIRKGMQDLKEMAQSIRLDVQNKKNSAEKAEKAEKAKK